MTAKVREAVLDKLIGHTHLAYFDKSLPDAKIAKLLEKYVYSSTKHTMTVGEFFVIYRSLSEVILLQSSAVDPNKFSVSSRSIWRRARCHSCAVICYTPERGWERASSKSRILCKNAWSEWRFITSRRTTTPPAVN